MKINLIELESAFLTGGRVLRNYCSHLKPDTLEALICAQDWIYHKTIQLNKGLNKKRGLINVPPFSAIHTPVFHTWFSASTPGFSQPL
jgi:hypothetical protein